MQVDRAGVEVDESRGDALSAQSRDVAERRPASLHAIGEDVRLRAAEAEAEVLRVEHGDLLLPLR